MSIQCSRCFAANPDDALLCFNCGTEVTVGLTRGRNCQGCGAVGPDDAVYCFNCGQAIHSNTVQEVEPSVVVAASMVSVPLDDVAWAEPVEKPMDAPPLEPKSSSRLGEPRAKLLAAAGTLGVVAVIVVVALTAGSDGESNADDSTVGASKTTVVTAPPAPPESEPSTTVKSVTVPMTARIPVSPTAVNQNPTTPTVRTSTPSSARTTLAPAPTTPPTIATTTTTIPTTTTTLPRCGGKRDVNVRLSTRSNSSPYEVRLRISNNTGGFVTIEQVGFSIILTDPASGSVTEQYDEWFLSPVYLDPDEDLSEYDVFDVGDDTLQVRLDNYQVDISEFDPFGNQVCS